MTNKDDIMSILKKLKPKYEKEELVILGLFGSNAKNSADQFSE